MLDTVGTVLAGEAEARAEAIVVSGEMLKDLGGAFWNNGNGKSGSRTKPATRFAPSLFRLIGGTSTRRHCRGVHSFLQYEKPRAVPFVG